MGFLFLDIESFVAPHNERSGLNPHHDESKVIVIAYNYYDLRKAPHEGEIKAPTFLYDWTLGGEKELLDKFWSILKEIHANDDFLKIVGFNQLAYDLPYLFSRMEYHAIAHKQELFDILFSFPRHVDLAQLGMAISEDTKRDEDFRCISQKKINGYFEIPIKVDNGKDLSIYYAKEQYNLIEKYVKEEFTFELLYQSILDYFLYVK
jgi:DNA polymerase elongation subunit (family B)